VAAPDSRAAVLEYLALLERHDLDGIDAVVAEDLVVIAPDGSIAFSDRADGSTRWPTTRSATSGSRSRTSSSRARPSRCASA
jgi:ketosteroid isomerase-like protein